MLPPPLRRTDAQTRSHADHPPALRRTDADTVRHHHQVPSSPSTEDLFIDVILPVEDALEPQVLCLKAFGEKAQLLPLETQMEIGNLLHQAKNVATAVLQCLAFGRDANETQLYSLEQLALAIKKHDLLSEIRRTDLLYPPEEVRDEEHELNGTIGWNIIANGSLLKFPPHELPQFLHGILPRAAISSDISLTLCSFLMADLETDAIKHPDILQKLVDMASSGNKTLQQSLLASIMIFLSQKYFTNPEQGARFIEAFRTACIAINLQSPSE